MNAPDFLITGLERAGTHWLSAMLNAHPEVASFPSMAHRRVTGERNRIGEMHLFDTIASMLPEEPQAYARSIADYLDKYGEVFRDIALQHGQIPDQQLISLLLSRYGELCEGQKGDKRLVGESTPAYVFYLDLIDRLLPGRKKICVLRDPKDRVVSWYFNQVRKGRMENTGIDDEFVAEYVTNRIGREYQALLEYAGDIFCVRYEALTRTPVEALQRVLGYLGVAATAATVANLIAEGSFERLSARDSAGAERTRGEELIKSHYRKGVVGDWKNHLSDRQADYVKDQLGDLEARVFSKFQLGAG